MVLSLLWFCASCETCPLFSQFSVVISAAWHSQCVCVCKLTADLSLTLNINHAVAGRHETVGAGCKSVDM